MFIIIIIIITICLIIIIVIMITNISTDTYIYIYRERYGESREDWREATELEPPGGTLRDAPDVHSENKSIMSEDEGEVEHLAAVLSVDQGGHARLPHKRLPSTKKK